MKSILSVIFIVVNSLWAGAQHMALSVTTEYTVAGHQYGASLMYETSKQWGLGTFYQGEFYNYSESSLKKDVFYGVVAQAPLVQCSKLAFFGNLRAGFVNKNFFVLVPGLETRLSMSKRLALGFGMSMRMSYPSVAARVVVKLF